MSLLPTDPDSRTPAADSYVNQLQEAQVVLQRELLKARTTMEVSANLRRRPAPPLAIGQKVCHITTSRPSSKLPFPIIGQVGSSSYRLGLPSSIEIHLVFHVSLLEPHVANTFPERFVATPPPIEVDGVLEFLVQAILDSRIRRRKLEYLVGWVGYDASDRTWEPACALANTSDVIADFHRNFSSRPR